MLERQRWVLDAVSVANGRVRELYSSVGDIGRPVWLARGNGLLIPHHDPGSGQEQLWIISYPGGEMRRLTNDLIEYGTDLDITRDGGTAAAISRITTSNVWVAPAVEPLKGRQITSGSLPMTDAAFNADGRVLAMSSDNRLWIMNADGNERTLLANEAGWLTPCGPFVVFASYKEGSATLTRINADGSNAYKIVSGSLWRPLKTSFSTRGPACSPEGQYIFYLNSEHPQKICRVPVKGGTPVEIAETLGDGIAGRLSISPDGKLLSYIYDRYSGATKPGWKLVVIPAGGGPPIRTFEVPGGVSGPHWSADGKRLQYLLTHDGVTNVWEQPLVGGKPRQLTPFTSGLAFEFAWSTDHKWLVLTRGSVSSDVVLLSNLR
jgi:Tol biopolymer transport system component